MSTHPRITSLLRKFIAQSKPVLGPSSDGGNQSICKVKLQLTISRDAIIYKLRKYGFVEVATIIHFLISFCDAVPDRAAYGYIREKLGECLDIHDNGSEYFNEIRQIIHEIDHVIACEAQEL
ncbi:MAG: hypothetical protein LKI85_07160 [Enterobacter sp.]|jgi:hypothetical protein|nr:hypothetical protein [Enterobacter sp.]